MATSVTSRTKAPWTAYLLMIVTGLGAAAALGAIASVFYNERPWLMFVICTVCTAGPLLAGAWALFVSKYPVEPDPYAEDNVESQWYHRAASGAFHDLMVTGGVILTVVSIARWDFSGRTALLVMLVFMGVSFAVRYLAQKRRAA